MARQYKTGIVITGDAKGGVDAINLTEKQLTELNKTTKRVSKESAGAFDDLVGSLFSVQGAIAGLATGAFATLLTNMVQGINQSRRYADALGVPIEKLTALEYAVGTVGIQADKLGDILKDTGEKIGDAFATGGGEAAQALDQLGLSAAALNQLNPAEQLEAIAGGLSNVQTRGEKIFILESLANNMSLLLPLLDDGAAGLTELQEKAESIGSIITQEEADLVSETTGKWNELSATISSLGRIFAVELLPFINDFLDLLNDVAQSSVFDIVTGFIRDVKEAVVDLQVLSEWVAAFSNNDISFRTFMQADWDEIKNRMKAMGGVLSEVGDAAAGMVIHIGGGTEAIVQMGKATKATTKTVDRFASELQTLLDRLDPAAKAAREYAENVALITRAQEEGIITAERHLELITQMGEDYYNASDAGKAAAVAAKESEDAMREAADATAREWERTAGIIESSLTDALMSGFESGKGFGEAFVDTMKNLFNTLILRPTIQALVAPTAGDIASMFTGGAGGGAGGAGGVAGGFDLMGTVSKLGGLLSSTSIATGLNTTAMNFGLLSGPSAALGGGPPAPMFGGANIGYGLAGIGGGLIGGAIGGDLGGTLGGIGGTIGFGLASGAGAFGAAMGAKFGMAAGPIGMIAGAVIGGLVGKFMGDDDETAWSVVENATGRATPDLNYGRLGHGYTGFETNRDEETEGYGIEFGAYSTDAGRFAFMVNNGPFRDQETAEAFGNTILAAGVIEQFIIDNLVDDVDAFLDDLGDSMDTIHVRDDAGWLSSIENQLSERFSRIFAVIDPTLHAAFLELDTGIETFTENLGELVQKWVLMGEIVDRIGEIDLAGMDHLIDMAGDIDTLVAKLDVLDVGFGPQEGTLDGINELIDIISDGMKDLDVAMPQTREEFYELATGLDLMTESGRETFNALLDIAPAFDVLYVSIETAMGALDEIDSAFDELSESVADSIDDFRNQIIFSGLDNEGQYDFLKAREDSLAEQLAIATDPDAIRDIVSDLISTGSQAFNLLDEGQQEANRDAMLRYLDDIDALAQDRIAISREEAKAEQQEFYDTLTSVFSQVATEWQSAGNTMMTAAQTMMVAAGRFNQAVASGEIGNAA